VRNLKQNSGAVAGVLLTSAGAAVLEIEKNFDRLLYDRVRLSTLQIHDKPDAAGIVFEGGIV
jgi:hypothetical protein